ncbi:hypothetical protein [Enterococcus gilvus]|uniref:hypothetical protein n=1 Tax=Enterococcus gilvus TaxID=160453 RepID=UPI001C8C78F6|nr:hypothetical protein [Enterococcus gilvus]MBX8937145.1 hypothetical protein [Enterococcus gilvus]
MILSEIKNAKAADDNKLNRVLDFFVVNLALSSENDPFSFQLTDEAEHLYLGFNDYGKKPKLCLQNDPKGRVYIVPFTSFSMDRLLVYLANEESLPCFSEQIDKRF